MKDKIESLQLLRAMAALMVVVNHLWGVAETNFSLIIGLDFIGGFGVDMFFILSGFIMCHTIKEGSAFNIGGAIGFLSRRIERIYPIFIIVLIPFLVKYVISDENINYSIIIGNILLLPSFNNSNDYHMLVPPSWTLVYEMLFYVILSAWMIVSKNKKNLIIMSSSFIVVMVFLTNTLSLKGERFGWVNLNYMVGDTLMINFVIGCLFSLAFNRTNEAARRLSISLITTSALILFFMALGMVLAGKGVPRLFSFGACSFCIFVLFITMRRCSGKIYNLFVYVGNASYSIYLTHVFFISINKELALRYDINKDLLGFASSVLSVVCGCLFYTLVEKNITLILKRKRISLMKKDESPIS